MSKEKKVRYWKPALIRTVIISALLLATLFMPLMIVDGVTYGESMFGASLFNGLFKEIISSLLANMLESAGANAEAIATTLGTIINIAVIVVMVIALIDLVFSIVALCTKNYNKGFRIVDMITMILMWICFVVVTALFLFFTMLIVGGITQDATEIIMMYDCPLYIAMFIFTLWLAILKCKLLKRHSFKA